MKRLGWMVLAAMPLLAGCEESVDAVLPTDRAFSLYGHVDPGKPMQAIRVFPIEPVLRPADSTPLDATVTISGAAGLEATFEPRAVTYWDGSIGHVFEADFQPEFETGYRLRVLRSDGHETRVDLTTPRRAVLVLQEASGVLGNVRLPLTIEDADQILSPRVLYTFESTRAPFSWTIPVQYDGDLVRDGTTWSMTVDLSRDIGVLYTITGLFPGRDPIILNDMQVEAFVATAEWTPPGGVFDSELLVQPGVFSNVQGGFGFVGAGYVERASVLPDAALLQLAGFSNEVDGSGAGYP